MRWRGPSLGAMSRVSSPVMVVGHSPVLAGGLLSRCGHRLLLSFGIGLLSSSGGDSGLLSSWDAGTYSGGFFSLQRLESRLQASVVVARRLYSVMNGPNLC